MSGDELLTGTFLCFLDYLKVILVFDEILKYKRKRTAAKILLPPAVILGARSLTFFLKMDARYFPIIYLPVLFLALAVYLSDISMKLFGIYLVIYLSICHVDIVMNAMSELLFPGRLSETVLDTVSGMMCLAFLLILAVMCRKYRFDEKIYPVRLILFQLFVVSGSGLLESAAQELLEMADDRFYENTMMIMMSIICTLVTGVGFLFGNVMLDNIRYRETEEMNRSLFSAQIKHYESIRKANEEMKKYRHDVKNHLLCLQYLISQKENGEAEQYIESLKEHIPAPGQRYRCGNDTVDAILNGQAQMAEEYGVDLKVEGSLPNDLGIDQYDLCVIFGNALVNAVEGAARVPSDRYASVRLGYYNNYIHIEVENSSVLRGRLRTSKKDKNSHGYGLVNIRECVDKLSGDVRVVQKEDSFLIDILIRDS